MDGDGASRILVAGVPRSGKSTLSDWLRLQTGYRVQHTDSLISMAWSDASLLASTWLDSPGPWVIEGVALPRAIRKWLARSSGKPADAIVWLDSPRVALKPGQATMADQCRAVWGEVREELTARGTRIELA